MISGLEAVYYSLGSITALRTGLSSRSSIYCRIRRYGAIIYGESTHPAEPVVSIVRSQFTCAAEIGTCTGRRQSRQTSPPSVRSNHVDSPSAIRR